MSETEGKVVPERKVNFRLTNDEYDTMVRIADMLFKNGSLKSNTVNALAKAACFTQINIYLQIEAKENAYETRKAQLEADRIALERRGVVKYDSIPNLGTY